MPQDFSKKMTIAIREDLHSWQLTNTVGHIAAYLGNKMTVPFDTGINYITKDKVHFPRSSQYPIIALKATHIQLKKLASQIRSAPLLYIVYIEDMIAWNDDEKLAQHIYEKNAEEVRILGIGMFGDKEQLKSYTEGMSLWK